MESNGEAMLRQLSVGGRRTSSRRWRRNNARRTMEEEEEEIHKNNNNNNKKKKRVMVVVDGSGRAKHGMIWALTHVANKGDLLTLLHVVSPATIASPAAAAAAADDAADLAHSLGALCKACKPEVEVEALVIQGPKLSTVLSQVRKLDVSVLVLNQAKPSPFCCFFKSSSEEFVEQCINRAECLTLAVRKQSKGVGGYLVSTRWQKNFWLLA